MAKYKEIRNSIAEFLIFQIEGKEQGVEVFYKDKTVWFSQKAMSMLFDCSTDNIGLHLKNIFAFGELYIIKQLPSFSRQFLQKVVEQSFGDDAYEL